MDKEVAETLAYFSQHAFELRQLGKDWGLNEEEIEKCIERAMSLDQKDLPAPDTSTMKLKFAARKTWPKLRITLKIIGVLIALVGLFALVLQNEEIDHRFSQLMQPALYPFFRYLRLAAVPLHDRINFYDVFGEECVVSNPLYSRESVLGPHACDNCNSVTNIRQFTAASLEQGPLPGPALLEPVLFKGKGKNVSFETFQTILSNNPFAQQPMLGVTTNLKWASQVKDLLEPGVAEKLAAQPDFYFFWRSKQVWTSQIMRKVFPKPLLLGNMEVAITRTMFISGPKAESFEPPPAFFGTHSWYMQGTGSRKMILTPVSMCRRECIPISVILRAGDMLTFNSDIYSAKLFPDADDLSIAFLGHFNPDYS